MTITFTMPDRRADMIRATLRPYAHKLADACFALDAFLARQASKLTRRSPVSDADTRPIYVLALLQGTKGGACVEFADRCGLKRVQRHDASRAALPVRTRSASEIIAEAEAMEAIQRNGRMNSAQVRKWRKRRAEGRA
ncbi:MAG: hypothetical protein Q7S99_03115 [Parvibaculum sp.]|nr:hypothetical protein [Parvibaculum sp.]